HIEGDDTVTVARETAVPSFGVTQARDDYKLTGDGDGDPATYSATDFTIAVVDTGIDAGHADFANGKIIGWADFVNGRTDPSDIMSQAIHDCVDAGIVVCVAAGNYGPSSYTIPAPGASPDAITVGTMIDPGKGGFALWTTSGRGPTADGRIKPDVVAPGYQIMAAKAGTVTENVARSGSSMATPFVAGVCALMLEANPDPAPAAT